MNFVDADIRKIKVNLKKEQIDIYFKTIKDRKLIDKYIDVLSSALPKNMISKRVYYNYDEKGLSIEYEKKTDSKKITVCNACGFIDFIHKLDYDKLIIDKKNVICLKDNPHWLIAGGTGSGKTYFANSLIIQAIIHKYNVSVLDIKKTYYHFADVADIRLEKDSILSCMRELEEELYIRQEKMREHLKNDSTLVASQCGIHNHLIVIEEYIALISVLEKNEAKEFEKILTNIVVVGRQLGMHVIVISQIALASTISSNIRSNLSKIAMKVNDESLLKTTFGLSSSAKMLKNYSKGEGLICFDTDITDFKSMTFDVQIEDIIAML